MAIGIVILVLSTLFYIILKALHARALSLANAQTKAYMASMETLYAGIMERINMTRRFRHDLAGHIQMLETLVNEQAQDADVSELRAFMEKQQTQYRELKTHKICEDEFLDAIFSIKLDECEKKKIPLTLSVQEGVMSGIAGVDRVALLFNLLDNAIEETQRIPQGEKAGITMRLTKEGAQTIIETSNYTRPGRRISFGTQKEKKEEHGFGTQIIAGVVEKYNGTRNLHHDEKQWILYDRICLTPSEDGVNESSEDKSEKAQEDTN